jgi:hypothetical protein
MYVKATATKKAKALCKKLGPGWTPHVWENMGWHYTAQLIKIPSKNNMDWGIYLEVYPSECDGKITSYWVDSRLPGQYHTYCKDPHAGIRKILKEARKEGKAILKAVGMFSEYLEKE